MNKIIANRGMGKTTMLANNAIYFAQQNPDLIVYLVTSYELCEGLLQHLFHKSEIIEIPNNLKIITYRDFIENRIFSRRHCKVFIDEIDMFLSKLGVEGYSLTIRGDY